MRRRSHTPPSDGGEGKKCSLSSAIIISFTQIIFSDVSRYKNTSRRMTELPGHSIQKYLSDRGKRSAKSEESKKHHDAAIKTRTFRRHQSLCPGDARSPRRLSACESVISEKDSELPINPRPALSSRLTHEEPDVYLMMSRSSRLRDRRQSTPVMYLTESLNKLALSRCSLYIVSIFNLYPWILDGVHTQWVRSFKHWA